MDKWCRELKSEIIKLREMEKTQELKPKIIENLVMYCELYKILKDDEYWSELLIKEEEEMLSESQARAWVRSFGEYWNMEETTKVAEKYGVIFDCIRPLDWWVVMNMVYSDNKNFATKHANGSADIFVDMAKNWLFDVDAKPPKEKLYLYYKYIPKR